MGPQLPPGGTVKVLGCSWRETVTGDIVVFREGFRLVAHRRLFRLSVGGHAIVYQKGDANPLGRWVVGRQVIGIVTEARDARGSIAYSRASTRAEARMAARRHILHLFGYPLKRMIGFCRGINRSRGTDAEQ